MTSRTAERPSTPSLRVVTAVADERDIEPTELTPPLGEAFDPEALDHLLSDETADVTVTLDYAGYRIEISDDDLSLEPLAIPAQH